MTREAAIAMMEASGDLVPDCAGCKERYDAPHPVGVFAPSHKATKGCKSGGRNHCTCDMCF
jgi:hypothetical protein